MSSDEVIERLDLIIKLLAMNIMKGEATLKEKILQLGKLGLQPKEIAKILNTTPGYVSKELSVARKGGLL